MKEENIGQGSGWLAIVASMIGVFFQDLNYFFDELHQLVWGLTASVGALGVISSQLHLWIKKKKD